MKKLRFDFDNANYIDAAFDSGYATWNAWRAAQINRETQLWAKKLAQRIPARAFRFKAAGDDQWQEFGGNGKLIAAFLEAHKKQCKN